MRRRRAVPIGESGPAQLLLQRLRTCLGGDGAGRGQRPRGLAVPVSGGLAPTVLFLGSRGCATVLPWDFGCAMPRACLGQVGVPSLPTGGTACRCGRTVDAGPTLDPPCAKGAVDGLTTVGRRSAWSASVGSRSVSRLTCTDEQVGTMRNPRPITGGQGVAGSNPVSPTVKPQVRGSFRNGR